MNNGTKEFIYDFIYSLHPRLKAHRHISGLSTVPLCQFSLTSAHPAVETPTANALGLSCLNQSPSSAAATNLFADTIPPKLSPLAAPPGRLIDSVPGGGDHATFLIWLPPSSR